MASTASSPNFFAMRSAPPCKRDFVYEASDEAFSLSAIMRSRSSNLKFAKTCSNLVHSDGETRLSHIFFRLADGVLPEVENGGGQNSAGMSVLDSLDKMVERSDSA